MLSLGDLGNGDIPLDDQFGLVREDRDCRNSLCIFDRFTELCKLELRFFIDKLHGFMHVLGDLTLPHLQELTLCSRNHATELTDLSFQGVPKACQVECDSCIHLMHPIGCHKPFTRCKEIRGGQVYFP